MQRRHASGGHTPKQMDRESDIGRKGTWDRDRQKRDTGETCGQKRDTGQTCGTRAREGEE